MTDEAELVDGAVLEEDSRKTLKIFIKGTKTAEYTFYKVLSKRNVNVVFKNDKTRSRKTNQKDLTSP